MLLKSMIAFLLSCLFMGMAHSEPTFPDRQNRAVVDDANVMSPRAREALNHQLVQWQEKTHHQLVVVTTPSLDGIDIATYGYQLGRKWKLGQTGIDDAAIIFLAPKEHKIRIEVGNGFEGILTDAFATQIRVDVITPKLKKGDIDGALTDGATAIMSAVNAHEADVIITHKDKANHAVNFSHILLGLIWLASGLGLIICLVYYINARKRQKNQLLAANQEKRKTDPIANNDQLHFPGGTTNYQRSYAKNQMKTTQPIRSVNYPSPSTRTTDFTTGLAAGIAAEEITRPKETPSYDPSSYSSSSDDSSSTGFSSSNDDWNNFTGGGSDGDY